MASTQELDEVLEIPAFFHGGPIVIVDVKAAACGCIPYDRLGVQLDHNASGYYMPLVIAGSIDKHGQIVGADASKMCFEKKLWISPRKKGVDLEDMASVERAVDIDGFVSSEHSCSAAKAASPPWAFACHPSELIDTKMTFKSIDYAETLLQRLECTKLVAKLVDAVFPNGDLAWMITGEYMYGIVDYSNCLACLRADGVRPPFIRKQILKAQRDTRTAVIKYRRAVNKLDDAVDSLVEQALACAAEEICIENKNRTKWQLRRERLNQRTRFAPETQWEYEFEFPSESEDGTGPRVGVYRVMWRYNVSYDC